MRLLFCLGLLWLSLPTAAASSPPRVVVSIAPLHSLVAGIMAGIATPELLVSGNASPHGILLRPSQLIRLQDADVIIWVGENVEAFLPRILATLKPGKTIIKVSALPGITRLAARSGGLWIDAGQQQHDRIDGHLWLDPDNARVIVERLGNELARIDATHARAYRDNASRVVRRLQGLDRTLAHQLAPVRGIPYLVFHDAYQYLERRYDLNPVGAITADPEHKPGARRLAAIRALIASRHIRCVFSEPQFSPKLPDILVAGTGAVIATLDPLGRNLPAGEDLYFNLMTNLGDNLAGCLTAN